VEKFKLTWLSKLLYPVYKDCIKSVAPDYPYGERAQHHIGKGFFRLVLNLKSGVVTKVTLTRSTGFAVLDNCAIAALRQWRWKPNRWKEVEIPVIFKLERGPHVLPRGAVPIPRA
jgi:TonB family protein